MVNKSLFQNASSKLPETDAVNSAGGAAYAYSAKQALAQLAATGCFNGTFYASDDSQLQTFQTLIAEVDDNLFLAKLAIYSRERAFMKDMPAALTAALAARDTVLFHQVFDRVIDNGRMLRSLFQMMRSGAFAKKSLSSSVQRAFQRWLNTASVESLLSASIGNAPSLRDILRMARPTPPDNARRSLFGWLTDKELSKWAPATESDLPEQIRLLQAFRSAELVNEQLALVPDLRARWDLLADSIKGSEVWTAIARTMGSQALRMNLNTLQRHGVFQQKSSTKYVADRLQDANEIRRSRQFPYQYFAAYLNASDVVPAVIKTALHRAAEVACGNVPKLPGAVVIGLDVSGSMNSSITGHRGTSCSSKMRCVDVAALFAAALLRTNPESVVIPFDTKAYDVRPNPSNSILSLAAQLAKFGGGGTDCSLPIATANKTYAKREFAGVILVSDNESWVYKGRPDYGSAGCATNVMKEWNRFVQIQQRLQGRKTACPKLVCIDLQPNSTTQAPEQANILNVGGFSDSVFDVVSAFLTQDAGGFVAEVEAIAI